MGKFSMMLLNSRDRNLWNEYVAHHPHAHVFHLWEWTRSLQRTYNYQVYNFVIKSNGEIVGVLPLVYIRSSIFGNKLVSLPFCEYGGPLLKGLLESSETQSMFTVLSKVFTQLLQRLKVDYFELRGPCSFFSPFLSSQGFMALRRYYTFRIDLTRSESELWKNLKRDARRGVMKATKAGIKVKDVSVNDLGQYYTLYLDTQKRLGSPPHSFSFFVNLYNAFRSKICLRMIMSTYDNKAIAGIIVFCFNDKIYWWNNVTDRKYANLYPTNFLLWHTIKWGSENNFKMMDFGRTRSGATGVYYFKTRWGGIRIPLEDYVFYKKNMEIPDPLQRKYMIMSKLWSQVPRPLARRIGPNIINKIGL